MKVFEKGCGFFVFAILLPVFFTEDFAIGGDISALRDFGEKGGITFEDIIGRGNTLKFYGFIRLDIIYDDSKTDNAQIPFYVLSEDTATGAKANDAVYTMHPRLSRLGIDFTGSEMPYLFGGNVTGKFEIDFQNRVPGVSDPNSGVESRAMPRIRHMYLKIKRNDFFMMGGQNWDIISPLIPSVSNDTLMWNAGNLGDRRAQLRFGYEPRIGDSEISLVGGMALTGALDRKDLDSNGIRDGEDAGMPQFQERVGYKTEKAEVGFWTAYLWEDANAIGKYEGKVFGMDLRMSLYKVLTLRGEAWSGQNLSDLRGGIGQGVNTSAKKEIRSAGGWIELLYSLPANSVAVGYTVDDPDDNDLPSSSTIAISGTTADGRTKNQTYYIAERFKPGSGVEIGIDYIYWQTYYKTLKEGINDRVNMVFQYNF